MSTPQLTEPLFARGLYAIIRVVGDSPENGEIDVYVLWENNIRRPTSELEEMLRAGQQPGKLVAKFKEGAGITILDRTTYAAWQARIRERLEGMRGSKQGAERLLVIYFLDEMLNPTSASQHSPQPLPASHHESL